MYKCNISQRVKSYLKFVSERAGNNLSITGLMVNPNPNPTKTTLQNN